jgi:hypothetical protein
MESKVHIPIQNLFACLIPTKFSDTHAHKKFRLPILVRNQCGMEGGEVGVVVRVSVRQDLEELRIKQGNGRGCDSHG